MKICPSCGKQCDDSSAFCGFCGFPLKDVPSDSNSTSYSNDETSQPNNNQPQQPIQPTVQQPIQPPVQQPIYQNNQPNAGYNNNQQYNQQYNYQPNNQQNPGFNQPPLKTDGYSLASMILGIVGLVFVCCEGLGFIPGIVAIIFGVVGKNRCTQANGNLKGLTYSKAGLIMGIIASALGVIVFLCVILGTLGDNSFYNNFNDDFSREFRKDYNSYYGIFQSIITMIR